MLYLHLLWSMSVAPCPYISALSFKILVFQTLHISSFIHYLRFKNSKKIIISEIVTRIWKWWIMIQNISTIAHKLPPSLQYSSLEDCIYSFYDFWVLFDLQLFEHPQPKVRTAFAFLSCFCLESLCPIAHAQFRFFPFQKWRAEPRVIWVNYIDKRPPLWRAALGAERSDGL